MPAVAALRPLMMRGSPAVSRGVCPAALKRMRIVFVALLDELGGGRHDVVDDDDLLLRALGRELVPRSAKLPPAAALIV